MSPLIGRVGVRGFAVGLSVIVVVAAIVVSTFLFHQHQSDEPVQQLAQPTQQNPPHSVQSAEPVDPRCAPVTSQLKDRGNQQTIAGDGDRITVLGDSYSAGDVLDDYTQSWPYFYAAETGARVTIRAVPWTGFVNPGVCGGQQFGTRAASVVGDKPDIIIVEGGLNDVLYSAGEVTRAAERLLKALPDSRIVVVGPVDTPAGEGESAVDLALSKAARASGAEFVSALEWRVEFGADRFHLTETGHVEYADQLLAAVE